MKVITIISFLILFSCASKNDLEIKNELNNYDIKVIVHNKDSLFVGIPFSYSIKNNSSGLIYLYDYGFKFENEFMRPIIFNEDKINLELNNQIDSKKIEPHTSKLFHIYNFMLVSNTKIDSSYWFEKKFKNQIQEKNLLIDDAKNYRKTEDFFRLKKLFENDSISFVFKNNDEYYIFKSARIGEDKFNTITSDDLSKKPNLRTESIYKPRN